MDAAVVAAPTHFHHDLGVALLERGIHVLMEKPLCVDGEEAEALVNLAEKRGAVLQTGHVERFNPAWKHLRESLHAPKYIEGIRSSGFTFRSTDVGVILDLMIHDIDLVLSLVGRARVRRVEAMGVSVMGGFEDVASARFEFESGCVAFLRASRISRQPARRMHVWASGGFGEIDFASRTAAITRPSRHPSPEGIPRRRAHAGGDGILSGTPVRGASAARDVRRERRRCPRLGIGLNLSIRSAGTASRSSPVGPARDAVAVAERGPRCRRKTMPGTAFRTE